MAANENTPDPGAAARRRRIEELLKRAEEEWSKLDHFFVALIFTVLGLAIQTAKWTGPDANDILQVIALLLLLAAGAIALVRLERKPRYTALQMNTLEYISLLEGATRGEDPEMVARIRANWHTQGWRREQAMDAKLKKAYLWQRTLFLVACFLLIVSRTPWARLIHSETPDPIPSSQSVPK